MPLVSYSRIPSRLYWRSWAHRQTGLSVIFPFSLVCVSSGDILWDGHTHSRVHPRHTRRAPMIRLSFTRACVHSTLAFHSTSIGLFVSQRHHFLGARLPSTYCHEAYRGERETYDVFSSTGSAAGSWSLRIHPRFHTPVTSTPPRGCIRGVDMNPTPLLA